MKNFANKLIKLLDKLVLNSHYGELSYQPIFEYLYEIGLKGMNYGNSNIKNNGEEFCINYLAKSLHSNNSLTVFDVGANKGDFTKILLEKLNKPGLKIYSFEPSKSTFNAFSNNVNDPRVLPYNIGLGEKEETLKLYQTQKSSGLSSLYHRNLKHFNIEMDTSEEIIVSTVDKFCREHKLNTIDFLKMDVEGHESKVLKGAEDMLMNDRIKLIQFEFGGCNIDSRTYFQDFYYMLKDKYQLYRIVKNGLYPIHQYQESYEVFKTTNFLAKHKNILKLANKL